ncbi:MAG: hypothetical protein J1E98_04560 [Lachnospiraceae bacterium]|nr:hypothetical protein [Lachnospiraceae bacterium]
MVFSDIKNDFTILIGLIDTIREQDEFFIAAHSISSNYQDRIEALTNTYISSPKKDENIYALSRGLNSLETFYSNLIATMSTSIRKVANLISQIEKTEFQSKSVEKYAVTFCARLNKLLDNLEEYTSCKIKNVSTADSYIKFIFSLKHFVIFYDKIYDNYKTLGYIENELIETIPIDMPVDTELFYLDIRSYKSDQDIVSFTDDLKLLANCLQNLERLVCPSDSHSIYIRKIESGSLNAMFGSGKINFSIFPDLVTSISNAINTWRLTPVEKEKTQAETEKLKAETELIHAQTEAQYIQNEGSKLAIINSQIDYLCEKLSLNRDDPNCIEQIHQFCLPLINYMESNPVGAFNGVQYDISKDVHLLENSSIQHK